MKPTAKTHKFEGFEKINVDDVKLRPILDQNVACIWDKVFKNGPS